MKKFKRQITIVLLLAMVFSNIQPLISYASSNNFESGSLIGNDVESVETKNSLELKSDVILGESKFSDDENKNEDEEVKDIEESEIDPETNPEETNPETEKPEITNPEEDIDKPQSEKTIDFLVTKEWKEGLFQNKSLFIVVNLLADGKKIDEVRISEEDNWKYTFKNLPKAIDGVDIKYTVEENPISNYKSSIDYVGDTNAVITNTYEPMGPMSNILNDEETSTKRKPENIGVKGVLNPNGAVDQISAGMSKWDNNEWEPVEPGEGVSLKVGERLRFRVDWEITKIISKELVKGDWFEFDLPSGYFKFEKTEPVDISAKNASTDKYEVIGTYEIVAAKGEEPAKIKIILNKNATEKGDIKNGYIEVIGEAKEITKEDTIINVGEQALPGIDIGEKPIEEFGEAKPVKKNGWQDTNKQTVTWEILVNYEDYKKIYNNEDTSIKSKENLILTDELPAGVEFRKGISSIDLAMPIYAAMKNGKLSSTIVENGWNNYGVTEKDSPFRKIEQDDGETWDKFQERVGGIDFSNENGIYGVYGIFIDEAPESEYEGYINRIVMNFGDLPGDLKSPQNLYEINNLIDIDNNGAFTTEQRTKTKEAYERIFNATKTAESPEGTGVIGFRLVFKDLSVLDSVPNGAELKNSATIKWSNEEKTDGADPVPYEKLEGGADFEDAQSVTIKKFEDGTEKTLAGAKFKLEKKNDKTGEWEKYTPDDGGEAERTTDKNGKVIFRDLSNGEYKVVEVTPPVGYTDEIVFLNGKDTFTINGMETETITITAYNKKELIDIEVAKHWDDHDDYDGIRPTSIEVKLYKTVGGVKTLVDTQTLSEKNNWSHKWTNLPEKENGKNIVYTVEESEVPSGYVSSQKESSKGNIVITNTHTPKEPPTIPPTNPTPEIDIEGEKTWEDYNNEGKRPSSIVVNLLADNVIVRTKTVTPDSNGNWKYSFTNLPKYKNDKLIKYTVEEVVPENYEASYNGYNIKNRYTEEETNITVKKVWDDENNKDSLRPDSIKVQLYGNGEKRGEVIELNESNNWSYNWTGLKKIVDGREVTYTVKEVEVPSGYEVNYDESVRGSVTITNTHKPKITNTPDEPREEPKEESKPEEAVKALKLSKILPKTGIGAMTSLTVSGISLLAVGMYLLKKKK